jgi:N-methylhydantoinase A
VAADEIQPHRARPGRFGATDTHETPVFHRADLPAGAELSGAAVVEQLDSTVVVPPDFRAEVDDWLNIRIHVTEEQR